MLKTLSHIEKQLTQSYVIGLNTGLNSLKLMHNNKIENYLIILTIFRQRIAGGYT